MMPTFVSLAMGLVWLIILIKYGDDLSRSHLFWLILTGVNIATFCQSASLHQLGWTIFAGLMAAWTFFYFLHPPGCRHDSRKTSGRPG